VKRRLLFDRVGVFMADIIFTVLKFTLMFINERKRNANIYLISNFDSLEPPLQIYRPRQLPSLPRPKFAPAYDHLTRKLNIK